MTPIMGYDPTGNWNWGTFFITVGIVVAAVAVIAVVAVTAGAAAPIVAGAIAAGSANLITQGIEKGYDNIDGGELLIQTAMGALYGASAMVGGLPGMLLKAGTIGLTQTAMGVYEGKSANEIVGNSVLGFITSMAIQGIFKITFVKNTLNKALDYASSKFASFFGEKG